MGENENSHPVMVCFAQILLKAVYGIENKLFDKTEARKRRRRVQNRWMLLYTLKNNPKLMFLRKHRLKKKVLAEEVEESMLDKMTGCCKKRNYVDSAKSDGIASLNSLDMMEEDLC